ncbi:MAG: hypothetical protein HYW69_03240 [Candidatus Nealsonbacteria bacterium]|nr:hypothetical protein [Candidatus Nealsonbacteria bacterium]
MLTTGKIFLISAAAAGTIIGASYFFSVKTGEVQGYEIFNPDLLGWQEATSTVPWPPRDSHALTVYKDKMWLMGGLNANDFILGAGSVEYWKAPHFADVWTSENGEDWSLIAENSPWGKRRSIQVVSFKDKMWLMGGWGPQVGYRNDIWYSEDGANWIEAAPNANWPAREGHSLVVFKDNLWLIGGVNYDERETKNDVWYSEDGINWLEATSSVPWVPRWDHAVTVFKDELWLIGGMDLNDNTFKDVWNSKDGQNWQLVTDNPPWQQRQGHNALAFRDKLWIIGRLNDVTNGGMNDIWFSEDGINWTKTKNDPAWLGREDSAAVVFKDEIWIMGGMDANWHWRNDVWHSVLRADPKPIKNTLPVQIFKILKSL